MRNIPADGERDQFWAELDALGEAEVRTALKLHRWHGGRRILAERWIEVKDQERSDASNSATLRIARSAKNAAWVAATSAVVAIIISIIALYLSASAHR